MLGPFLPAVFGWRSRATVRSTIRFYCNKRPISLSHYLYCQITILASLKHSFSEDRQSESSSKTSSKFILDLSFFRLKEFSVTILLQLNAYAKLLHTEFRYESLSDALCCLVSFEGVLSMSILRPYLHIDDSPCRCLAGKFNHRHCNLSIVLRGDAPDSPRLIET